MSSISVVIPTYNYGCFIKEAIESALLQTLQPLEIIVVDDGSTDETEEVVRSFARRVRYFKQENAGVCVARNRGVAESNGKFIAFLDADDRWCPSKLEKQLAKFSEDAEIGLVHCGMKEFDSETGATLKLHLDGSEGFVADELLLWEKTIVNVSGSNLVVRREVFELVQGFDQRLKVSEDLDFCYRVAKRFKVGFVREPLVEYRSHSKAAHHNIGEMERCMTLFYNKALGEDERLEPVRRRVKANLHKVLSGSYYVAGDYRQSVKHAAKSIYANPALLMYFLRFPARRLNNR